MEIDTLLFLLLLSSLLLLLLLAQYYIYGKCKPWPTTEDRGLVITTLFVTKDFAVKSNLLFKETGYGSVQSMNNGYFLTFFLNHTFYVFVRIASARRF